jgi:hypothetical protein
MIRRTEKRLFSSRVNWLAADFGCKNGFGLFGRLLALLGFNLVKANEVAPIQSDALSCGFHLMTLLSFKPALSSAFIITINAGFQRGVAAPFA